jgi:hypothetical protein
MCLLTPSFEDFLDYFYNFGAVKDSAKDICLFTGILVSMIIYEIYLSDTKFRKLMMISIIVRIVNSALNLILSLGFTLGLSTWGYVCLQALLFQSTHISFADLPVYVLVAKLIPVNVESSMFGILSGISAFSSLVYGRLFGCAINTFPKVTT